MKLLELWFHHPNDRVNEMNLAGGRLLQLVAARMGAAARATVRKPRSVLFHCVRAFVLATKDIIQVARIVASTRDGRAKYVGFAELIPFWAGFVGLPTLLVFTVQVIVVARVGLP